MSSLGGPTLKKKKKKSVPSQHKNISLVWLKVHSKSLFMFGPFLVRKNVLVHCKLLAHIGPQTI